MTDSKNLFYKLVQSKWYEEILQNANFLVKTNTQTANNWNKVWQNIPLAMVMTEGPVSKPVITDVHHFFFWRQSSEQSLQGSEF